MTMKYMKFQISAIVLGLLAVLVTACSPDSYDMPQPGVLSEDLVEGKAFVIEHDAQNPNVVYLKSLMPANYQIAWETPQGRFVGAEQTLRIAFEGDYEVRMGVSTPGGYVWSNPTKFSITTFCTDFVDHYLWTRLSGGVGQSKTWQLDLAVLDDGSTKTTYWKGPHWFFNRNYTWDHLHSKNETESTYANYMDSSPWDKGDAINPEDVPTDADGSDPNWYWAADYAGNSWMCGAANYGYITFDLIDGAHVTITDASGNVVGKGTYILDVDNHTLSFSDVYPLSSEQLSGPRTFRLLYLSDTAMQLLSESSNKSINYVTKEYFDNYVPDAPDEPTLPDGWREDINQTVSSSVKWTLSNDNPLDWFTLAGNAMNGWKSPSDYPDWLGVLDPSIYAGFSLELDSKANVATFTLPDGSVVTSNYTLDDKGIYSFETKVPSFTVIGWASFAADSSNALRIVSIEKDDDGRITGMWLGARSDEKDEYLAYHLVR